MHQCTRTGLPICRPMTLTDRADPGTYGINDQFMVGNDLLVAPVVTQGTTSRDVYLPRGSNWYAYQDNKAPLVGPNVGGSSISWYVPWDVVPIYVRAGAVIPRRELEQYVGQLNDNKLPCTITYDVYPGPASTHTVYLDDRNTPAAQGPEQAYRAIEVSQVTSPGQQTVTLTRVHDKFIPAFETFFFVALLDRPAAPTRVTASVNGSTPSVELSRVAGDGSKAADDLASSPVNAFYFNTSLRTVFLKVLDPPDQATISIVAYW